MNNFLDMNNSKHIQAVKNACKVEEVKLAHACWFAIFANLPGVITPNKNKLVITKTKHAGVKKIETKNYTYLEQNPNKPGSKYAQRARAGERIIWIREKVFGTYLASVENGSIIYCKTNPITKLILSDAKK